MPGSLISSTQPSSHIEELLTQVKNKTNRPAVQTKINQPNIPQPEPPLNVTHVYTLQHKRQGLDPSYCGPFKIDKRLTRSTVRIIVGKYKDGTNRTESRHWSDLKAIKLEGQVLEEQRPNLGRKPKQANKEENPSLPTKSTGPPSSQPFTGFAPSEIKKKKDLFADCDWSKWDEAINTVATIDFTKPPPSLQPWSASENELNAINNSIRGI